MLTLIEVNNRQKLARVGIPFLKTLAGCLMAKASRLDPDTRWAEISVVLMDDAGMAAVNGRLLQRHEPTDVIALRYAPLPGDAGAHGELWVNVERALGVRRRRGWNPAMELALYVAHGCDHLHGADDATPSDRARMRRRELRWLRQAACREPATGILGGPA